MKPRHKRLAIVTGIVAAVGAAATLTLAPWCSVFHHFTEK